MLTRISIQAGDDVGPTANPCHEASSFIGAETQLGARLGGIGWMRLPRLNEIKAGRFEKGEDVHPVPTSIEEPHGIGRFGKQEVWLVRSNLFSWSQ